MSNDWIADNADEQRQHPTAGAVVANFEENKVMVMNLRLRSLLFAVSFAGVLLLSLILVSIARNRNNGMPSVSQEATSETVKNFGPLKYLPEGARIEDQTKYVIFADIDGDGQKEQIIFYSNSNSPRDHKAGILVLKEQGADYIPLWQKIYSDSNGFADPTGIYDLNKTGKLQIFAYRTIGASCPGILEIFAWRSGKVEQITGPWANNGECQVVELKDLNGDGNKELVTRTRDNGTRIDIYVWNGRQYVQRNDMFPRYYGDELAQLLHDINSGIAFPISTRITWCKQAVRIYLLRREYAEAVQLSEAVLVMIDNPDLTKPNSIIPKDQSPDQQERSLAWFEAEKTDGKVTIHRLLADTFKAAGDLRRARKEIEEAQTLESAASDEKAKIRP